MVPVERPTLGQSWGSWQRKLWPERCSGIVSSNWRDHRGTRLEIGCLQQAGYPASSSASGQFLKELYKFFPSASRHLFRSWELCLQNTLLCSTHWLPLLIRSNRARVYVRFATLPLQFDFVLCCKIIWISRNSLFYLKTAVEWFKNKKVP